MTLRLAVLSLVGVLAGPVRAEIQVTAVKLDGTTVTGPWGPVDTPGRITIHSRTFETAELMSLRPERVPDHTFERAWPVTVWLASGAVLPAEILAGGKDRLRVRTPLSAERELTFEQVAAVRWNRHREFGRSFQSFVAERGTQDQLLAIREDRLNPFAGSLEALGPDGGVFNFRGRSAAFSPGKAWGVVFAETSEARAAPLVCIVGDEHRVAGEIVGATADSIRLQERETIIEVPVARIREIRFNSDRVLYLSQRTPTDIEQRPFFDVSWPVRFDRSVSNGPLTIRGRRFGSGIGVHAWCGLRFDVPEGFRQLAATVGIDDATRGQGRVQFVVLGETGRELFRSDALTGQDAARDIIVDITGQSRIRLIAEPLGPLDIGGHANWADARLIK